MHQNQMNAADSATQQTCKWVRSLRTHLHYHLTNQRQHLLGCHEHSVAVSILREARIVSCSAPSFA